jgi:small subunit ribosomal protein S3
MIETKFIKDLVKEFQIQEYISETLKNVGFSHSKLQKTPLGEKIVIYASRPGLIVGKKGENIQKLTLTLKSKFKLENPQIEIIEVEQPNLDANIVAERIASSLERFGVSKFKGICHKMLTDVLDSGARGIEILISGKVPSSRAKRWRFYQGYLKKSGEIAISGVRKAYAQAKLKTGIIGVQVRLLPPDVVLPDTIKPREQKEVKQEAKPSIVEEQKTEQPAAPAEEKVEKEEKKQKKAKKSEKSKEDKSE